MRDIFHYDLLAEFNIGYYKDVINSNNICGDEISISEVVGLKEIKKGKKTTKKEVFESKYYFPLKKGRFKYLLRTEAIEKFPLIIKEKERKSVEKVAYWKITKVKSLSIKEEKTMSFREMIDYWLPYEHDQPELFRLYKIIVHIAYARRINVRIMTYPGWLKDSPVETLGKIRGNAVSINKPNYPRLKREIAAGNSILALNEMQGFKEEEKGDYNKFYEDTGDFKSEFRNPSCKTKGTEDVTDIRNMSTLTFYNVPKKSTARLFDDDLDPKNCGRVLPFFFIGGDQKRTACRKVHGDIEEPITQEEEDAIVNFLRVQKYYSNKDNLRAEEKKFTLKYELPSNRWQRNYNSILKGVSVYARTQDEFSRMEELLYRSHRLYEEFLDNREPWINLGKEVVETTTLGGVEYKAEPREPLEVKEIDLRVDK